MTLFSRGRSVEMNKAFRFRLYPNEEQQIFFQKCFDCSRFVYNKMLADKIEFYQENKQMLNNTPAMYKEEFPWLKEVDSLALANAQMNLQTAFRNFFKRPEIGFPKFKSKRNSKKSYTTNNINGTIHFEGKSIKLPKIGLVKIKIHRNISKKFEIKSATISQNSSGKYYISILVEYENQVSTRELDKSKSIGLDYSSPSFYIDSEGRDAGYPKFFRTYQNKLAFEQRKLSRMKLGSNNYYKQRLKVAKVHEKIANSRNNWIHNLSKELCDNYDIICVEDINLRDLSQCLTLGKSTMDNGFGTFRAYLHYKQNDRGHKLIKIDRWYPSSKTCNECGAIYKGLQLSERAWVCPECGTIIERDKNAAKNILQEGLKQI